MKKLLLIDGMAAVYRAYYALGRTARKNSKGMNTAASLGFTTTLYDLLRLQQPTHVAVAFDLSKPTFRHEMYEQYKANREAMPEDIQEALPYIHQIIAAMNIAELTCKGYEADDVIGTVSHKAEQEGFDEVVMVTPDKDFAQLVTQKVHLYRFGKMGTKDMLFTPAEVCEKWSVSDCRQIIDLLGLWGDSSDNIPGIPGVGEKTAKKLIAQFGSIEAMVERADEIKNDKLRESVKQHSEDALFSKKLATIALDAPVKFDEDQLRCKKPDYATLKELFDLLEFRNLSKRIYTDLSIHDPEEAAKWHAAGSGQQGAESSQQAAGRIIDGQPTLFDNEDIGVHPTTIDRVTLDVMPSSGNVALFISGATLALAVNADSIYSCKVGNADLKTLRVLLADETTLKLCFDLKNLKYTLDELGVQLKGEVFDVQLAHYLTDAEARHSFDYICSAVTGFSPTDTESSAAVLWQLYPKLSASLHEAGLEKIYREIELPLVDVLMGMEREGVKINVEALKNYSARLTAERDAIEKEIYADAGHPFNINSPRQLGEVLYDELKITEKPPLTSTKQYSTAEDVLMKLKSKSPIVEKILEYRSLGKLIGTYLDSFPKLINPTTGRLHTIYNQTVTATGRLSSSNPNLQNIPIRTERGKEIRRAFVARDEEHVIMAADYSQIELRIIASLAKDRHLLQAFNSHQDIHASTAAKIYKLPIEEVTKDQRRNAKSVNFGIVYGISAFGLSEQLGIPRSEAAALITEYFTQYPDIKAFIDKSVEFAHQYGYAQTLLGRRRYLYDINSRNQSLRSFAERNAVNMPIQGTSADMIKIAMNRIAARLKDMRSKMILQVHDELVFDVYRPELETIKPIVTEEMKNALPLEGVEIDVSVDVGDNWLDAH
ncbi:MAG: DNA polymerase I [Bacteroidales bacterium]|nr:DNA polymerase I [Bacteroidales bacterium]